MERLSVGWGAPALRTLAGAWEWPGHGKTRGWSRAEYGALTLPTSKNLGNQPGCEPAVSRGRGSHPCFRTHLGTLHPLKALEEDKKAPD